MNGRFFRCLASLGFSIMQQLLRCAPMQRENQIHSMGSNQPSAAFCTKVCSADFAAVRFSCFAGAALLRARGISVAASQLTLPMQSFNLSIRRQIQTFK